MYGVSMGWLNEQVERNLERFPPDFGFCLTPRVAIRVRKRIEKR